MNLLDFREPVSAWSHCTGLILALPGATLLWRRSAGDRPKRLSLFIYGSTLAFCYAASTLFHGLRVSDARIGALARLDGAGIFALIAGSYTPLAWCLMRGRWRRGTLAVVWSVAAAAMILIAGGSHFSTLLATCLYLGMGWGAVACYFELAQAVSHRALAPIVAGGLFYTIGAVLNLLHWPVLLPGIFGAHELFHMFVLAGSLAHYGFMLKVVVPFVQGQSAGLDDRSMVPSSTGEIAIISAGGLIARHVLPRRSIVMPSNNGGSIRSPEHL
jgi:hemolysin III